MSTSLVEQAAHARRRVTALLEGCPLLELPAGESRSADELPAAVLLLVDAGTVALLRSAEATARRIVLALAGPRELLLPPGPADLLADAICEREQSLGMLARFPHVERVRAKLLQLARSHGRVSERGVLIHLPLTHDLLAGMVGSARETVTWAIRELVEEGFVSRDGRLYRLHVPPEEIQGDRRPAP